MSLFVTLAADLLVAVLLAATIVTSLRLSRRIGQLKADEAALKGTVGDLMVATASAERAIAGLRAAIDECDRSLDARIDAASAHAADLAAHAEAGREVIAQIASIVAQVHGKQVQASQVQASQVQASQVQASQAQVAPVRREPAPAPPPAHRSEVDGPNGERLSAAGAAALAMTERALARVRARAA